MERVVAPGGGLSVLVTTPDDPDDRLVVVLDALPTSSRRATTSVDVGDDGAVSSEHGGTTRAADVVDAALWHLTRTVAAGHALPLHAGMVARDGRGALLVGSPGAGKSTAVAAAAASGWEVVTDELVLLDHDRRATGLARPVVLRPGGRDALVAAGAAPKVLTSTDSAVVVDVLHTDAAVVGLAVFLDRDGDTVVEAVHPVETLVALLAHVARPRDLLGPDELWSLAGIALAAPGVRAAGQSVGGLQALLDDPTTWQRTTSLASFDVLEPASRDEGPARATCVVLLGSQAVAVGPDAGIHVLVGGAAQLLALADGDVGAAATWTRLSDHPQHGPEVRATARQLRRLGLLR